MTFIYIVKTLASKWIKTLSNTHMIKDLVANETQSMQIITRANRNDINEGSSNQSRHKV